MGKDKKDNVVSFIERKAEKQLDELLNVNFQLEEVTELDIWAEALLDDTDYHEVIIIALNEDSEIETAQSELPYRCIELLKHARIKYRGEY